MSLHYDAQLWGPEDPNEFHPERHRAKRHAMAFLPFSGEPRACLGMCFALTELRMPLCQILRRYLVLLTFQTEQGFQRNEIYLCQPNTVYVKLKRPETFSSD